MTKYIALLRGVNVGGNNKIAMPELKAAFENHGFTNVITYINSGNMIFSAEAGADELQIVCEGLIAEKFGLHIAVFVLSSDELVDALAHAPDWWNDDKESKHNAIFVIPPATAEEVCDLVGEIKPEYEKAAYYGNVIFWSAPTATFSRARWSKMVHSKTVSGAITARNANTALKLAALARDK